MTTKPRVLFLCTGNSCRSQMAEGWARALWPDRIDAYSAGIEAHGLNARAVRVMAELGVDISTQRSRTIGQLLDDLDARGEAIEVVVTVCAHARETCPIFPRGALVFHRGFDDPPALTRGSASEEDALEPYRRVRDEIRAFIEELPGLIERSGIERNDP